MKRRLDLLYFDAGGGHRAAATALAQVVERQQRPFSLRLVNLQEALDEIDVFRKVTGVRLQDLYNLMLKKGWTLGSPQLTAGMQVVIRLFHRQQVRVLERFWRGADGTRPDLVVSLVPNLNRAIFDAWSALCRECRLSPSSPTWPIIRPISGWSARTSM